MNFSSSRRFAFYLPINKKYVLSGQVEKIVEDDGDGGKITYYKIGHKEIRQKHLHLIHGRNYELHYAYVSGKVLYVEEIK